MLQKQPVSLLDIVVSIRVQLELLEDAMRTQVALGKIQEENAGLKRKIHELTKDTETEKPEQSESS